MKKIFALLDCNNFFVSCERVFNPTLRNKPVVVLSNNDGCVVSRSNEAKALQIPMGAPYFKCRDTLKQAGGFSYSANFALYGDLSARVMQTASLFAPEMEVYSIDEAFLYWDEGMKEPLKEARLLRARVMQDTGMPVSIGIAPTKTLAKAANQIAKKNRIEGVFALLNEEEIDLWLGKMPVEDIWGIGRKKAEFLREQGVLTALQLKSMPDSWIKQNLTIMSLKTVWELRGIACIDAQDNREDKKSITTSRTFAKEIASLEDLNEPIAAYMANAAEKLREQESVCGYVQVYLMTNRFKTDCYYANMAGINLNPPTAYTPDLIKIAQKLVKSIYREGDRYKKAGVILLNILPQASVQEDLFAKPYHLSRKHRLMGVIDAWNSRHNSSKMFLAAEGVSQNWYNQAHKSQRFTTRWDELLEIAI